MTRDERLKTLLKLRKYRYEERREKGRMILPLEVDPPILDLMLRHRIATEAQVAKATTLEGRQALGQGYNGLVQLCPLVPSPWGLAGSFSQGPG